MLRVAVINTHPIQHFAPLWREIAAQQRVKLRVFYCSDWGAAEYHDPDFDQTFKWDVDLLDGYDSQFLKSRKRPWKLGFWEINNSDLEHALHSFGPDVVVLFGYNHLTTWRALLWARRRGVRTLVFCDSELKHPRPLWRSVIKELVVRFFFALVDGGLPIGDCNAHYLRHYGMPDERLYWSAYPVDGRRLLGSVANPTEARALIRERHQIDSADFVFASIGKYIRRKRHQDVVHAWMRLPEGLRSRSSVMLIGEGAERKQLEQLAIGANGRVVLTGFVNQSAIASYYAACDALVVASELDPHPLVVTEALFFGLPVIASDSIGCIGPNDTLREGRNGLVYRCGDVRGLSAALEQLMVDEALRQRLSVAAREIASGQDTPSVAARFAEAFQLAFELPVERPLQRFRRTRRAHSDLVSSHRSVAPLTRWRAPD